MSTKREDDARLAKILGDVQIPLHNMAYVIETYLEAHEADLDPETRQLLIRLRDCADRVAGSVRRVVWQHNEPEQEMARAMLEVTLDEGALELAGHR